MNMRNFAASTTCLCAAALLVATGAPALGDPNSNPCNLPAGVLDTDELPEGSSVEECNAVGLQVQEAGLVVLVPAPGGSAGAEEMYPDGAAMFEVEVAEDGAISYSGGDDSDADPDPRPAPSTPPECNQTAYNTNDLKEYGRYNFYVGDGSFPASMTQTEFAAKVVTSLENIITAHNNCGLADNVDATGSFTDYTTLESDITNSNGYYACDDGSLDGRDGSSVWDAGNIDKNPSTGKVPVARTCWWSLPTAGIKNDLLEADVRFNITDYDFTNTPNTGCSNKYDVVSVGTHEAGHVYGLAHVSEADYPWMTMSVNAEICDSTARTLGKGDVRGLESIY